MKHQSRMTASALVFVLVFLVFPKRAYAYLDPGTGSYFLQLFLAFFVGAIFAVKLYWKKINAFMVNLFARQSRDERDNS